MVKYFLGKKILSNYIAGLPAAGKREKMIVSLFHLPHHPTLQTTMKITKHN